MIQYAITEWLTDIRKNQLPGILGGVGPMHSVVQLCESTQPQTTSIILFYLWVYFFHNSLSLFVSLQFME